jgi:hypothetical protein
MTTPVDKAAATSAAAAAAAAPPPPPTMPVAAPYPPQGAPAYGTGPYPPPGAPMMGAPPGPMPMGMVAPPPRPNLPPELVKSIKTASIVNFALTMAQLLMSLAIVIIVRESLEVVTVVPQQGGAVKASYQCYMEPAGGSGSVIGGAGSSCQYAYALASTSIFACFFLSLMQCLTVDCCGNGRMVESLFDVMLSVWWIAGAITLTVAKNEADAVGTPQSGARQAVVTLSWFSGAFFLILGGTNGFLAGKLAKAKKIAMQQQQEAFGHGLATSPFAPALGGHTYVPPGAVVYMPGQPPQQQQQQQMPGGAPMGYPQQQPQWQQQAPPPQAVAGVPMPPPPPVA